jgi:hypothetical protein
MTFWDGTRWVLVVAHVVAWLIGSDELTAWILVASIALELMHRSS